MFYENVIRLFPINTFSVSYNVTTREEEGQYQKSTPSVRHCCTLVYYVIQCATHIATTTVNATTGYLLFA